jgi:serine/threonine protein kinase
MDYHRISVPVNNQQPRHNYQASINSHIYASLAGIRGNRNSNGLRADASTMWWDDERIEATVTRQFVLSQLRPDEQERLDSPLGFGDGLTDDTYWEWIELKAKRIFLILVDLGVPDQIFGVIDDSWDDDDLPVPLDQVERLRLTFNKDEKLEKKFFIRQFDYLLRFIRKGENIYYSDAEVVTLEQAEKRPVGAVAGLMHSNVDKVQLPGRPDDIFLRRRIHLGEAPGRMPQEEFLAGLQQMRAVEHYHLTSLWASYIYRGFGYLLLTPVHESTLKSFLSITPPSIKILAKRDRRILLLNWIHCLADAIAFLHGQGIAHGNVKPSNVMLDVDNNIFLGDTGIFPESTITGEKRGFDKEAYDYSSPEQARPPLAATIHLPVSRPEFMRRNPGPGSISSSSGTAFSSSVFSSTNEIASVFTTSTDPIPATSPPHTTRHPGRKYDPQKSDIFSLGTIFLEILTFLLKRASRNFASHRSAKNKTPGRGGGLPDSSFHKNLGQVETWMSTLTKEAGKKEDQLFRGVSHIISLCAEMLQPNPDERPNATIVKERLYTILFKHCGLGALVDGQASTIHCDVHSSEYESSSPGFDQLRLDSQRAAAAACASVNPLAMEMRTLALGNGGVIYGIETKEQPVSPTSPKGTDGDRLSMLTKSTSRSSGAKTSETQSSAGKTSRGKIRTQSIGMKGSWKPKPKARAHEAPIYASMYRTFSPV